MKSQNTASSQNSQKNGKNQNQEKGKTFLTEPRVKIKPSKIIFNPHKLKNKSKKKLFY